MRTPGRFLLPSVLLACTPAPVAPSTAGSSQTPTVHGVHWAYRGDEGPAQWGHLDPAFAACASGTRQSPIDLALSPGTPAAPAPTRPRWQPITARPANDGHTIRLSEATPRSSLTLDGTAYVLQQLHFHSPSEHTIAGQPFAAEAHLVHRSNDGKFLVVAILMRRGQENATLRSAWSAMPPEPGGPSAATGESSIDVNALLPPAPRYLRYDGSFTTPPCTEGVTWLVVEPEANPTVEISDAQIEQLRAATQGATNRPTQPLNGRAVVALVPGAPPRDVR
jgi:carbonic anhydrase